jgi:uncharacterized protein (TIGR02996 family)
MDDGLSLLAGICASPDDDTARLVYADWLQENGQAERAEFVRVQVGLSQVEAARAARLDEETDWSQCTGIAASWCPNCGDCACADREESMSDPGCPLHSPDSPHCCFDTLAYRETRLRGRERELYDWNGKRDAPGIRAWAPLPVAEWGHDLRAARTEIPGRRVVWQRGFVGELHLPAADWLANADALVWRPNQTPCPRCKGTPGVRMVLRDGRATCPCDGSGTVPRPCPPTAQPITRVTLTDLTREQAFVMRLEPAITTGTYRSPRWPGISFHLTLADATA